MTQHELDQLVATATGEPLQTIRHLGFSIADPEQPNFDPEPYDLPPQVVDWDTVDRQRRVPFVI